MEFLSIALSLQ